MISVKPDQVPEEETFHGEVPEGFPQKIESLLKTWRIEKWNGFHKINKMVMDGDGFSLRVRFHNGKTIFAHGYMRYPRHFPELRAALDAAFLPFFSGRSSDSHPDKCSV